METALTTIRRLWQFCLRSGSPPAARICIARMHAVTSKQKIPFRAPRPWYIRLIPTSRPSYTVAEIKVCQLTIRVVGHG